MIRDVGTSAERAGEVGPIEEIKIENHVERVEQCEEDFRPRNFDASDCIGAHDLKECADLRGDGAVQ
jgi:hypothetical protein